MVLGWGSHYDLDRETEMLFRLKSRPNDKVVRGNV